MAKKRNLFQRLNTIFRSGPIVKRKIQGKETASVKSSGFEMFKKSTSNVYGNALNSYGQYDRLSRYADFSEMEYEPIIARSLAIYAEEAIAKDAHGRSLHVYSENPKIQSLLEELFYDTLNWEFVGPSWTRDLCKYGDYFLMNDVSEQHGIINAMPIPVNEIEREEGFDPNDPFAVRFRWVTQGNQVLENWQVSHFRLSGNDAFLPYGSSIIEPARRIWRQLVLVEDAMLVYRVIRSPERRVFYIDVGNTPPNDIPNVLEQAKTTLKSQEVVDKTQGRVDQRYNPWSVDIDYFLPVRGTETGTRIETLPGGVNTTAIDDVEYILNKLFTAVGVPKPYLNYSEGLSSKANLAQEDVRFARTVNQIQQVIISELNKIAAIHLAAHGYDGSDLIDFTLQLSNPSTMAVQQQLELVRTRFEIAATKPEQISDNFVYKKVFFLSDEEIKEEEEHVVAELRRKAALEEIGGGGGGDDGGFGGGAGFGGGGEDFGAGEDFDFGGGDEGFEGDEEGGDEEGGEIEDDEELFAGEKEEDDNLLLDNEDDESLELDEDERTDTPVKQRSQVSRVKHNQSRHVNGSGAGYNSMPDIAAMLHHNNDSFKPEDERWKNSKIKFKEQNSIDRVLDLHLKKIEEMERVRNDMTRIDPALRSRIASLRTNKSIKVNPKTIKGGIIKESDSIVDIEIDEDEE